MASRLLVRSVDRTTDSSSSSNFKIQLRNPISGKYWLKNCLISNTIYNINSYNNGFAFTDGSGSYTGLTLTVGNYDSGSLATEIKTRMEAANGASRTYTITFSSVTNKFTFAPSAGNVSFQFSGITYSAHRAFGFAKVDTSASSALVSTNPIQLDFASSLLIRVDEVKRDGVFETSDSKNPTSFNLYVPLDTSFGVYKNLDSGNFKQCLDFSLTKTITLVVTDSSNQQVDLNSSEWEMLLEKESC